MLISVLLVIGGFFVWSLAGNIEKEITASAEVSNGAAYFTVKGNVLQSGMNVKIGDTKSLVRDTGKNKDSDYIGAADVQGMRDGIYEAKITVERIRPIDLLFN